MLRSQCPVSRALAVIAGKWKPLILRELKDEGRRFGQLQRRIAEASQKVLTSQLRQLERDGLVERSISPGSVLRTQYTLTAYGQTLRPALLELAKWGQMHGRARAGDRVVCRLIPGHLRALGRIIGIRPIDPPGGKVLGPQVGAYGTGSGFTKRNWPPGLVGDGWITERIRTK